MHQQSDVCQNNYTQFTLYATTGIPVEIQQAYWLSQPPSPVGHLTGLQVVPLKAGVFTVTTVPVFPRSTYSRVTLVVSIV
jgi:hypothetical protein